MKSIAALFALIFVAGCSNSGSPKNNPAAPAPPPPGQQAPVAVGFTAHAWCYVYPDQGQDVQDRFMFNEGGLLNYQMFAAPNHQRGQILRQANGQWSINGTVLQLDLNGQRYVFQIQYNNPDPVTRFERLHVYMNGQDLPYDPCY